MQVDTGVPTIKSLLENALSAARKVSSSVGLLSDLYGELGIAKQDADAVRLATMLEMIFEEAEEIGRIVEQASEQARLSAPGVRPVSAADPRPVRTASVRK